MWALQSTPGGSHGLGPYPLEGPLLYPTNRRIEVQRKKQDCLGHPELATASGLQPPGSFPSHLAAQRNTSAAGALNLASSSSLGNFSRTSQIGAIRAQLGARTPSLSRFPGKLVPSSHRVEAPRAAPKVPRLPGLEPGYPDQGRARQAAGTRTPATRSPGWGTGPPCAWPRRPPEAAAAIYRGNHAQSPLGAGDS